LKHLNKARWILIVVGVLTIGLNVFLLATLKEQLRGAPQPIFDQLYALNTMMAGVGIALGVVFIILGILVKTLPVACTVTGLVLYIVGNIVFMVLSGDPKMLFQGAIVKVFIVVALAKSVQAAIAYQKETQSEALAPDTYE